jgi:uncharacterized protein (DUF983 family)
MERTHTSPGAPLAFRFDEPTTPRQPVHRGSVCPKCGEGLLDYNGLLDLECPNCGYVESGGGGCT